MELTQFAEAFGMSDGQALPQAPQLCVSFPMLTSQPLEGLPSQLENGELQVIAQVPALQLATLFGPKGQSFPQPPQLLGSIK
jgi:hypothetical protein